jgi:8-oxo-dGTP pyrophosphatase MutT (NUDIX family)
MPFQCVQRLAVLISLQRLATTCAMSSNSVPRIDSETPVAATKWLALKTLHWTDQDGNSRLWDVATRTTKQGGGNKADAVVIVPILRNGDSGEIETLLVEQFRPSLGQVTVEFPAGLIDAEETVEHAALRELREETGYVGEACRVPPLVSRPVCMSPGLCDETVHAVIVEVDMRNLYNQNPKPELDPGEHVTVKRVPLREGFQKVLDQGSSMPIMGLYLFAIGYELGASGGKPKAAK